jgi:hypothetical protein
MDKIYTSIITMLGRFTDCWCLADASLAHFMANYTLRGCGVISVSACIKDMGFLTKNCYRFGFQASGENKNSIRLARGGLELCVERAPKPFEVIKEFARDFDRMELCFPANIGAALDGWSAEWTEIVKRSPEQPRKNCFFDTDRVKNACDLLLRCLECGKRAGIADKMFLGFGGMLGYALLNSFLPNDDDIDLCIQGDDIPQAQLHQYLIECKNAGLTENRMRGPETINGKYCWFSIGNKSIEAEHGVKCCNWVWFRHGGYNWHSKGRQWIGRHGLDPNHITAKGIPEKISSTLKLVKFCNCVDVNILDSVGKCLDHWYPGWVKRKKESSKITCVLVIPDEADKKTWYIQR